MSSNDLIAKYKLTAEGLQNLFQELDRAGLLRGTAEHDGVPAKVVINIHQIVEDIKSGMTRHSSCRIPSERPRSQMGINDAHQFRDNRLAGNLTTTSAQPTTSWFLTGRDKRKDTRCHLSGQVY